MKEKDKQSKQIDVRCQEVVDSYSSYFPSMVVSAMIVFAEKNSEAVVAKLEQHENGWTDPFDDEVLKKMTLEELPQVHLKRERATLAGTWVLCSVRESFSYGNLILPEDFL